MYPRIIINQEKYRHNVKIVQNMCRRHSLTMMAVTKVFCAVKPLTDVLREEKVDFIADSRLANLEKVSTNIEKVLLRLVSLHEVDRTVNVADMSLNSEIEVIRALDHAASYYGKRHSIILMIDIGDLREGIFYKERVHDIVSEVLKMKNIILRGIGTNLTCFGAIIPTEQTLKKLIDITTDIEESFQMELEIISGGNSSHLHLLDRDIHIEKVNNLRIGEALALGRETAFGNKIDELYDDVFTLEADIIELKRKPSLPEGEPGMDAFGKRPEFTDLGVLNRAILGIGKQDVDFYELIPFDKNIRLLGSSSDHIIASVPFENGNYKIGDVLKFKLTYGSLLSLMTSEYVEKVYVKTI